jgi:hypothetical protein
MERILVGLFLALSVFYVANEAAMTAKVIRNHIRLVKA